MRCGLLSSTWPPSGKVCLPLKPTFPLHNHCAVLIRPLRVPERLLLSPATLVVAPPTLLNHWELQLHKAGHNAQRLWSYCRSDSSKPGYALPPGGLPALAWQYDVVLTTREGLSHGHRAASLLAVHWLRIVVDEGHIVGGVNTARFARLCALSAERRWIMTGTGCVVLHMSKKINTQQAHQRLACMARRHVTSAAIHNTTTPA